MATSYGATDGLTYATGTDVEQDAKVVVQSQAGARSGRWLSLSVIALVVTSCVLLVVRSTSSSSMASSKLSPLAFHKTTTEDEETAVDTAAVDAAVWVDYGSWEQNGLGYEINYNYLSGGSAKYNALGGTDGLDTLYVTDTDGYLKVSSNGGSSWTVSQSFKYAYGCCSTAAYTITQVAVAGSSGSIAYASTKNSANYGGGYSPGKIFKTSDGGASWTAITPSTYSSYYSYAGVATSSTGQYVLAIENSANVAYVSKDYGSTYSDSVTIAYSQYYPFRACAVSASGQHMYIVSDNYLFIHKSYGSSSISWGNTNYYGITSSWSSYNKISVSSTGDKLVIIGHDVLYSENYGATLTKLSPTDTTNSCTMVYKIVDAQISPDGGTVAVIQSGSPSAGFGNNEAYIRCTTDAASGASATWSTLYPSSLGKYKNNWFITAFRLNTAGTYIVTVSPTTSYYDSSYRQKWKNGNGWHGAYFTVPTAAPTMIPPTSKPTPVPTHTPAPTAEPTPDPTNKPVYTSPAPSGVQVSGKITGKRGLTNNFNNIASTSSGAVFAAYRARGSQASDGKRYEAVYGSLDQGVSWTIQTTSTGSKSEMSCNNGYNSLSSVLSGLKATYSSTMKKNVVWFTCGPYEINFMGKVTTYVDFKVCTASTTSSSWFCKSTSANNLVSHFQNVGASAVSSDGLKYAIAGEEGGLVLMSVAYEYGSITDIRARIHNYASATVGNAKYGGLAWSSDGAYLLVAPHNGLNLWYVTIPSTCFTTTVCYLSSLTKTTSPSLPASGSGTTGTWTSCVAQTDKNYMACTQYGGYTYFSTNKGVSWSKVGSKATYIRTLAMYSSTTGKACLAGISTYGSPYLMTSQDGQSTTEWVKQYIGDTYYGNGFRDVTVTSCSNIYATAIVANTDNNILVTSGSFSETDSTGDDDTVIADTTDYNWTWGSLSSSSETAYSAIAASSDGIYMYAASTNSTIGVSSDGGASWTTASGPGTADWTDISCSSNGQYVAVGGATWGTIGEGDMWTDLVFVSDGKVLLATSEGKTNINQAVYSSSSKSKKSSSKKSSSSSSSSSSSKKSSKKSSSSSSKKSSSN